MPELSRQTYDTLCKALREVILNSLDAGALHVEVDLSRVECARTLEIIDDGSGMTLDEIRESFLGLGGSTKYGNDKKFGRIGIGALALLHYARVAEIETKVADSSTVVRAVLTHPWWLDREQRAAALDAFPAGSAAVEAYAGSPDDHFTRITLRDVGDSVVEDCSDVGRLYGLVDRLRTILPLPWPQCDLSRAIEAASPEVGAAIQEHVSAFAGNVVVRTPWEHEPSSLSRRLYSGDGASGEEWSGEPLPILKDLTIRDGRGKRTFRVVGYLLAQRRAVPAWSGVTARVQNVAVEERTFFGLESDPGFRKYITGEIYVFDNIDRARLINIDRTSFNRESADYRALQRFMVNILSTFKARAVQQPQRRRVALRQVLEEHRRALEVVARSVAAIEHLHPEEREIPSSHNGAYAGKRSRSVLLANELRRLGAIVEVDGRDLGPRKYEIRSERHDLDVVTVGPGLLEPGVEAFGRIYRLRLVEARPIDPPLLVRNRPREIIFNLGHPVFKGRDRPRAMETLLTLELAYLFGGMQSADELYHMAVDLLSTNT